MNIIYDTVPYGALPIYHTNDDEQYYTITDGKVIQMKKRNKVLIPLFDQKISKKYKHSDGTLGAFSDFWNKEIKKKKIVPDHIVKLFEDINCSELRIISHGESTETIGAKDGVNCCWSRQVGYLGVKI